MDYANDKTFFNTLRSEVHLKQYFKTEYLSENYVPPLQKSVFTVKIIRKPYIHSARKILELPY